MVDIPVFTASELGHQFKAERKALGLTQQQLASRVGVTRQTVIDVEHGRNVSLYVVMGVLAALGKALKITDARASVDDVRAMFDETE
ncbi:MAG: helix-turn-helix domain-containing protein [Comamonadaceae bacterium]|nr:MAG: helix-turn-helix domain-containing protein [Comamonadaceae bacterium]